jgi:hypothetical protein
LVGVVVLLVVFEFEMGELEPYPGYVKSVAVCGKTPIGIEDVAAYLFGVCDSLV